MQYLLKRNKPRQIVIKIANIRTKILKAASIQGNK